MNLEINIKQGELAYSLSSVDQFELVELIMHTDSIIAEVEFTERLLLSLAQSLKNDLEDVQKAQLLLKLNSIFKGE